MVHLSSRVSDASVFIVYGIVFSRLGSLGWTNNATLGSILCYCFYWIAIIGILVCTSRSTSILVLLKVTMCDPSLLIAITRHEVV